jgi:hypothetical protein
MRSGKYIIRRFSFEMGGVRTNEVLRRKAWAGHEIGGVPASLLATVKLGVWTVVLENYNPFLGGVKFKS